LAAEVLLKLGVAQLGNAILAKLIASFVVDDIFEDIARS
jgi:hypothetical protein